MQAFVIAIIDVHIKLTRVNDRQLSFFLQEEFRLCRDFLYIGSSFVVFLLDRGSTGFE